MNEIKDDNCISFISSFIYQLEKLHGRIIDPPLWLISCEVVNMSSFLGQHQYQFIVSSKLMSRNPFVINDRVIFGVKEQSRHIDVANTIDTAVLIVILLHTSVSK